VSESDCRYPAVCGDHGSHYLAQPQSSLDHIVP